MSKNFVSWLIVILLLVLIGMIAYVFLSGGLQCRAQPLMFGAQEFSNLYENKPFKCMIDDFGQDQYKIDCFLFNESGTFQEVVRYSNFYYNEETNIPIYTGFNFIIPTREVGGKNNINWSYINVSQ